MNKSFYLGLAIILVMLIVGFVIYPHLPSTVASHWDAQGQPNGYSSPLFSVIGLPIIAIIFFFLLYYLPRFDPLKENYKYFQRYYDGFILMFLLFFLYLHLMILVFGLGYTFNFTIAIIPAFFFLFLYLGIMFKHTKRNYFVGIRTPWALQSDNNWDKTHLFGSKLFIISAFIGLLGFIFPKAAILFIIVPILTSAIACFVYSYIVFKDSKKDRKEENKKEIKISGKKK